MIEVNSQATERIIRATVLAGSQMVTSEIAVEKCLQICAHWYCESLFHKTGALQKKQRSAAHRLHAAAKDLLVQLESELVASYQWIFSTPELLRKQLSDLSGSIETSLKLEAGSAPSSGPESDFVENLTYRDHFKAQSPLEWLVGVYLVETYGLNFTVKKGTIQKNYNAFAMAVLKELGIKSSDFSIESIRRASRGLRDRRKTKKADDLQFHTERQQCLYAACGRSWKRETINKTSKFLARIVKSQKRLKKQSS